MNRLNDQSYFSDKTCAESTRVVGVTPMVCVLDQGGTVTVLGRKNALYPSLLK
jgi:hypothetical protein